MTSLQAHLPQLRTRIAQGYGKRSMNEQNTKATLIDPVLRALGWDTEDIDEVAREYKPRRADKPVDYALLSQRTPRLFIEAKALGQDLNDRKWAGQIMGYAGVAGVEWVVLTNGDEWRIYNTHAAVAVDEKLFRAVRISAEGPLAQETLALLAKEQWDGKRIESLWQAQFVDRKVKKALDEIFRPDPDIALVNIIRKRCSGVSPKDVRESLGRAHFAIDFPPLSESTTKDPTPPKKAPTDKKRSSPKASGISHHDLLKSGLVKAPLALERTYKGQTLRATLSADGRIVHGKEVFDSLSAAGGRAMQSVLGGPTPPACNGWDFWNFRDQSGKLAPIGTLRQRCLKATT